jgi:hypothetical protein
MRKRIPYVLGSFLTLAMIVALGAGSSGGTVMSWLRPETGAVRRALVERLNETVSVKDFGAVGNGSTDDSSAISAALTALNANSGGRSTSRVAPIASTARSSFRTTARQRPTSLRSASSARAHTSGQGQAPVGGTILDLRYAGLSVADGVTTNTRRP